MLKFPFYVANRGLPLQDDKYWPFVWGAIRTAATRVWVSQFIINLYPHADDELKVRIMYRALLKARRRGCDVRVIVDRGAGNADIASANRLTYMFFGDSRLPVRYSWSGRSSNHAKFVVIDSDLVILGSHNFSDGALRRHNEDSVAIWSADLNAALSNRFLIDWTESARKLDKLRERAEQASQRPQQSAREG